eukprot:symbB.v1.2.020258.t1/scaffold1695.1/size105566/12
MSGLRLKVVPDDGPRFLMPVPRATELVADLIKHLHLRTSQGVQTGKILLKINGFALLPTQRLVDVLHDGDEVTMSGGVSPSRFTGTPSPAFFGYKTQHVPINQVPEDIRKMNANALGNGLTLVMCVPWTVCGIFYTALHWTYEADYVALQKKQEQQLPPDEDEEFLLRPPFWTGGSPC